MVMICIGKLFYNQGVCYFLYKDLLIRVELFDGNIEFIYDMFYGMVNGVLNNDVGEILFENVIYESV